MESLYDTKSDIYISAVKRTEEINMKLEKSRLFSLNNNCVIGGTKKEILLFLKGGPAKNLINSFFKYKTNKCDYCNIEKNNYIQLDRAHCNKDGCDRASLLEKAINVHFIDEQTIIKIKEILITFIKYHEKIPLFILCKKCHREYDSKLNIQMR